VLLVATLALLGAAGPTEVKLAAPGFQLVDVKPEEGAFLSQAFAAQLSKQGLSVITAQDVAAVIGMERQKQLVGCEESGCLAEIGNALGADGTVVGTLAKVDGGYRLNLKIISPSDAAPLASWSVKARDDAELVDAFRSAAPGIAADLRRALHRELPTGGPHLAPALTAGLGLAAAIAGAVCIGLGEQHLSQLRSLSGVQGDVYAYASEGKTFRGAGITLAAVGGAALITGLLWSWLSWNEVAPTAMWVPGGATFGVAGAFR
jgi:hypothetical protein